MARNIMTKKEVMRTTGLIAKFMDIKVRKWIDKGGAALGWHLLDSDGEWSPSDGISWYYPDVDWGQLMPVVEKIAKDFCNDFDVTIYPSSCHINSKSISFMGTGKMIDAVYEAVVEFIRWQSKQHSTTLNPK